MSQHENLTRTMQKIIDDLGECAIMSPAAIAGATLAAIRLAKLEPDIEYLSLEQLKAMARRLLAKRFDPDGEENPAYSAQGEMFSGKLQQRYPVPQLRGEPPAYKRTEHLTDQEALAIAGRFKRCSEAHIAHGAALMAFVRSRELAA